jgi:hypothetical protein
VLKRLRSKIVLVALAVAVIGLGVLPWIAIAELTLGAQARIDGALVPRRVDEGPANLAGDLLEEFDR